VSGTSTIQRVIQLARHQLGTPYVWGGAAPGGFDCSGLLYWAYNKAGYHGLGRTTYQMIKQGVAVSQNHLLPGDAVFPEPGHVGLYVGNGMVLEAPHTGDHVKLIPLSQFGFLTARRFINGGGGVTPPKGIGGVSPAGLPIPSPNPADRQPHPGFLKQAALSMLLSQHLPTAAPTSLHLPSPQMALQNLEGIPGAQPVEPSLPGLPGQLTAQASSLESSLQATRRQLLGGV
jgi:hypothetical protein